MDDALLWADNVEKSFKQAVDWLHVCGENGIILNPEKFTFAQGTVDFAGFSITMDSIRPSSKYLKPLETFQLR